MLYPTLSVREINRLTFAGKPVVALYMVNGYERHDRILRARQRDGHMEVKVLGSGRWHALAKPGAVWPA